MARKQAKRRKQKTEQRFQWPRIRVGRILSPFIAAGIVFATYQLTLTLLDREISAIEISGPFQRVTALQLEAAISEEIDAGFVGADIDRIQQQIVALAWIDQARIARRWPSRILITVTEQVPAAVGQILDQTQTRPGVQVTIEIDQKKTYKQQGPGRPGKNTHYTRQVKPIYRPVITLDADAIKASAAADGIFPLFTDLPAERISPLEILSIYKYQPFVEKRHDENDAE